MALPFREHLTMSKDLLDCHGLQRGVEGSATGILWAETRAAKLPTVHREAPNMEFSRPECPQQP